MPKSHYSMTAVQLLCVVTLFFSLLCVIPPLVYKLVDRDISNMSKFSFELNPAQYDLRSELDVYDCEYIEDVHIPPLRNKHSDLRILHLNVRGLVNKQNQLARLLNETQADVALICETWLTKSKENLIDIKDNKLFAKHRADKIGGGVCILAARSLRTRHRPDLEIESEILEHIVTEIKTDRKNILLVSGYRPPNTNVRKFLKEYKELIQQLRNQKNHEIILGIDHNLDLLKSHQHQQTHDFIELNLKKNLLPTISKPTRVTTKSATLIDNMFVSTNLQQNLEPLIILDDISDHMPCMITLFNQKKCRKEGRIVKSRSLTEKSIELIKCDLRRNWEHELEGKNVDESFKLFHTILMETIDKYAPEVEKRISAKKLIRDPWITKGLIISMNKQRKLYQNMLVEKSDQSKQKYTTYRNKLKGLLRASKRKYLHDKCFEYKQNSKKLWELTNRIIGKENNKMHSIDSIRCSGILRSDPYNITTTFNDFFSTIGENYASKHHCTQKESNDLLQNIVQNTHSLFLEPCTIEEVKRVIMNLPQKTSSGYDNISNILLKKLSASLLSPLNIIFNKSLSEGKFPETMKKADIVPLYKSKDEHECTNYRPISLLPTLSKLLEKIMYKRTYSFLENTGQLYNSQYGFREGHSCENAVSELLAEIIKGKQEGFHTVSMFLDLSKAFDTLEHKVLLNKLEKYGIRGIANEWYRDYLTNRKVRTKCNVASTGKMEYSDFKDINYGTPQGSCLGPLIFIIFTNDIHKEIQHCKSLLFADDTTIYKSHRNLQYLTWCIEDDMRRIISWFRINKLTLNLDKTVCILFQKQGHDKKIEIAMGDLTITNTKETKFLGMWIDEQLKWNTHIQKLILKLTRNMNLLRFNQHMMPTHTKKLVYHSHIASHIQYGLILWGNNATEEQMNKLQKIQNKCMKYILPYRKQQGELNSTLEILKIKDMLQLANWKFGYKLKHHQLPPKITTICQEDSKKLSLLPTHHYNTRTKNIPNLPNGANKLYKDSFLCKGPRSILSLDLELQKLPHLQIFTSRCKKQLIKNYY